MCNHGYTDQCKVTSWEVSRLHHGKEQGYILCILYCNRKEQRHIKGRCKITSWTGASLHLMKVQGHITGGCKVALRKEHGYTLQYMCKVTSLEGARLHLRQVQGTLYYRKMQHLRQVQCHII